MSLDEIRIVDVATVLDCFQIQHKRGMCRCPIHGEKHPSFSFRKNLFKCFACDAKGDTIGFVMQYKEIDFLSAVKTISDLTGVPFDPSVKVKKNYEREALMENKAILLNMLNDEERELSSLHRFVMRCEPQFRIAKHYTILQTTEDRLNELTNCRKVLDDLR